MNRKFFFSAFIALSILLCGCSSATEAQKETVSITSLYYTNNIDYSDGVDVGITVLNPSDNSVLLQERLPFYGNYPVCVYTKEDNSIIYSNANPGDSFDNLYRFSLDTGKTEQLTYGQYLFNDLFLLDKNTIACNVSSGTNTVTQPALFDIEKQTLSFLDETDTDTWTFSFSGNQKTRELTALMCSDSEMRSPRVCSETFIRPKKIVTMDYSLSNPKTVFETEDYEIRNVRQLDSDSMLLVIDPRMDSSYDERTLEILSLSAKSAEPIPVSGLWAIQTAFPIRNGDAILILAKDETTRKISIFSYDFGTKQTNDYLESLDFRDGFIEILDFVVM